MSPLACTSAPCTSTVCDDNAKRWQDTTRWAEGRFCVGFPVDVVTPDVKRRGTTLHAVAATCLIMQGCMRQHFKTS